MKLLVPRTVAIPAELPAFRIGEEPFDPASERLSHDDATVDLGDRKRVACTTWLSGGCSRWIADVLVIAMETEPEAVAATLVKRWGPPAGKGGRSVAAWFGASQGLRVTVDAVHPMEIRRDGHSYLVFSRVQPDAAWISLIGDAMAGKPVMPSVGMTRAQVRKQFGSRRVDPDSDEIFHWPRLASGDEDPTIQLDFDGDKVSAVRANADYKRLAPARVKKAFAAMLASAGHPLPAKAKSVTVRAGKLERTTYLAPQTMWFDARPAD
jgi:hypothetical protein